MKRKESNQKTIVKYIAFISALIRKTSKCSFSFFSLENEKRAIPGNKQNCR